MEIKLAAQKTATIDIGKRDTSFRILFRLGSDSFKRAPLRLEAVLIIYRLPARQKVSASLG
jgi:hypothetical protein